MQTGPKWWRQREQPKKKLHVPHTFLYCDVLQNNNVNLPSYKFYGGDVVGAPVRFFFFHCRSCSLWWPLALLIFSPPLLNVFLPKKFVSIVALSPYQWKHYNLVIVVEKTRLYRQNARVVEMRCFILAYMRDGCTYGRFCQNQNFLDT